jgi:hypothetical protein
LRFEKGKGLDPVVVTNDPLEITGYSDADWAADKVTRRSTSGIVVKMCGATILAKSKRQPIVADSTVAAEIIALQVLVKEAIWLRNFMKWLGYEQSGPTTLWCDNLGAVRNCVEGAERHKTKHMDIKYMFIRDVVRTGEIEVRHIGTEDMVADVLTKGLRRHKFEKCRNALGLIKGSV